MHVNCGQSYPYFKFIFVAAHHQLSEKMIKQRGYRTTATGQIDFVSIL